MHLSYTYGISTHALHLPTNLPQISRTFSLGEDRRFKVWDAYGRQLFQSAELEHAVTCVSWSPSGDLLAVGTYNTVLLCDRSGWTHCKHRLQTGSLFNISWTQDGTQFACAGGNGAVVFCQVVGEALESGRVRVTLDKPRKLVVEDLSAGGSTEEFEMRDPVVKFSLGFGFLVVATTSQGLIYNTTTWGQPVAFDLRENVTLIRQAERCFLIVDSFSGIQVMSYEGRRMSNPKFQGLQTDLLRRQSISLSSDTLAVIDRKEGNKGESSSCCCSHRTRLQPPCSHTHIRTPQPLLPPSTPPQ